MTMSRKEILEQATDFLKLSRIGNPRLEARLLLQYYLDISHEELLLDIGSILKDEEMTAYFELLKRRSEYEPIGRIIGEREFYGLNFKLSKDTLEPRCDSETIIDAVISYVKSENIIAPHILDLGTGTGCLLLASLSAIPMATGIGVDISSDAINTAKNNAERLGLAERAVFQEGDWANGLTEKFDIIISNPPYIREDEMPHLEEEVRLYDPKTALVAGEDGLDAYRIIIINILRILKDNGRIFLEIGVGQGESVRGLLVEAGFKNIELRRDLSGINRCIMAYM